MKIPPNVLRIYIRTVNGMTGIVYAVAVSHLYTTGLPASYSPISLTLPVDLT